MAPLGRSRQEKRPDRNSNIHLGPRISQSWVSAHLLAIPDFAGTNPRLASSADYDVDRQVELDEPGLQQ
jgi:hypothetical protein